MLMMMLFGASAANFRQIDQPLPSIANIQMGYLVQIESSITDGLTTVEFIPVLVGRETVLLLYVQEHIRKCAGRAFVTNSPVSLIDNPGRVGLSCAF
jgi:hypothetical protein